MPFQALSGVSSIEGSGTSTGASGSGTSGSGLGSSGPGPGSSGMVVMERSYPEGSPINRTARRGAPACGIIGTHLLSHKRQEVSGALRPIEGPAWRHDSAKAFWAADGRPGDPTPALWPILAAAGRGCDLHGST